MKPTKAPLRTQIWPQTLPLWPLTRRAVASPQYALESQSKTRQGRSARTEKRDGEILIRGATRQRLSRRRRKGPSHPLMSLLFGPFLAQQAVAAVRVGRLFSTIDNAVNVCRSGLLLSQHSRVCNFPFPLRLPCHHIPLLLVYVARLLALFCTVLYCLRKTISYIVASCNTSNLRRSLDYLQATAHPALISPDVSISAQSVALRHWNRTT